MAFPLSKAGALKVLHVYKTYLPEDFTGVPRVIHSLATGMAAHGVESHVLTLGDAATRTRHVIDGHHVHIARRDFDLASSGFSWSAIRLFRKLSADADVVHYHFPWPMGDVLQLLAPPKARTIVTYHSDIVKQQRLLKLYAPLRDHFLQQVNAIVATSPNYVATSPVLQRFLPKTTAIPIGLPDEGPIDRERVSFWQNQLGQGFFLFLGALRYYKGLPFLMEASRLANVPIVVAGGGDRSEWEAMAGPNVRFTGSVTETDKAALLHLCRAFVFPSHLRSEAFGVSLIEAARAGRPMICAEIGTGTTFVNIAGETGLVVPPADPEALAQAMEKLSTDTEMAERMGQAARRRYERELGADKMIKAYLALYRA